jgi:hypothetical protein
MKLLTGLMHESIYETIDWTYAYIMDGVICETLIRLIVIAIL